MRVVIISDFGTVNGGAAKVAIESARGLAEAGVDVVFACAIGSVSERLSHPRIQVECFAGAEIWKVAGKLAAARQGIWNTQAHAFLTGLLARQPADTIVHLHQWTKAFSPAAIAAAGRSGLAVAITMHDYFSFCPTGGYFDFEAGAPCRRKPMSASCITANCDRASYLHKLVRVARQWRSDEAMKALKDPLFIHVSDFARRFAEPFLPRGARHIVVENMMEAHKRPPADVAANRHALFLGRFTQEKGVLVLARAAAQADMPLLLVGSGETDIKAEIGRLNPAARILDWVAESEVSDVIQSARCLVAPSLWYETGPMTVHEAMALGVPAVLARGMGAAGRVAHGKTGLLIDDVSDAALSDALQQMKRTDFAAELGLAAYGDYWAAPLTLESHVADLILAYRPYRDAAIAAS